LSNNQIINLQRATAADAEKLLAFSKKTFYDFYAHLNTAENMEAYSAANFTVENMLKQLNNPNSEFYFALNGDEIAGYTKLNFSDAQTDIKDDNAMEVERIYVSKEHHGKYIGKQLLEFAIERAAGKQYVWLGVWERNDLALAFYKRNGFVEFSQHIFQMGDEEHLDLLMKKVLNSSL
jgi:ribosomal protein S18 acetylase RimI-like enzyme